MPNDKPKSWRDVLPVHRAADLFPMMPADELKALGEDIKKNGLTTPIAITTARITDPDGRIIHDLVLLDGRNRLDAMELVGIQFSIACQQGEYSLAFDGQCYQALSVRSDPYAYVVSANIHRRHLNTDQKRELIAKLIKAQPKKSNRQIANATGASHPHVAKVRAELEKTGDVETVTTSTDTKGRKQPAHKAPNKSGADDVDNNSLSSLPDAIEDLIDKHGIIVEDFVIEALANYAEEILADDCDAEIKELYGDIPNDVLDNIVGRIVPDPAEEADAAPQRTPAAANAERAP